MRVNVYAEEMTDHIEIVSKEIEGHNFTGLRIYLHLPVTVNGEQHRGPFMHREGDDDSSAVTFWGKRDLRGVLKKAMAALDEHYARAAIKTTDKLPEIGSAFEGGIYAGSTLHAGKPAALVLLEVEAESMTWEQAREWAAAQGGELPSRHDGLVLFANLKSHFREDYYWTSEQHAADSAYAWYQYFSYGYQGYWRKSHHGRARAVRRLPI